MSDLWPCVECGADSANKCPQMEGCAGLRERFVSLERELAEAKVEIERLAATRGDQKRTIAALMEGVEERIGKEGTTPVLRFIGSLEREIEAMRPVVEAAKMCDQSCCLDPDDLYVLRKKVAEYEASKKEE